MDEKKKASPRKRRNPKKDVLLELRMKTDKGTEDDIYIFTEAKLAFSEKEYEIMPRELHRGEEADFYIRVSGDNEVALALKYFMPLYLNQKHTANFGTQNLLLPQPAMPVFCNICRKIDNHMTATGGVLNVEFDTTSPASPPVSKRIDIRITEDKRK